MGRHTGYHHDDYTKQKISKALMGKQNALGSVRTPEQTERLSIAHKKSYQERMKRKNNPVAFLLNKLKNIFSYG